MRIRITPATVVASAALVVALSGTAVAATGGTFVLGRSNSASSNTTLTNSKGTALILAGKKGIAPFGVNGNKVKVPSLNADLLDGQDSTKFQLRVAGQCGSTAISAISSTGSVTCVTAHQLIFSSGTASFTIPAGVTRIQLSARGGGGAGGNGGTALHGRGGGGGQGGLTETLATVSAGQVFTVVVGAGGAPGGATSTAGGDGQKSSVLLTPSPDSSKFDAIALGGTGGAAAVTCGSPTGAARGDGGTAPAPTAAGALGLSMSVGADGTAAGVTGTGAGCDSGGAGGGGGYAGSGGDGGGLGTSATTGKAGLPGVVEVTLIN